jgi:DNA-binding response OmpR family regulator
MTVLIAEDDRTSRCLLVTVLGKAGYDVVETDNGAAALDVLLQPTAPRVAILDWMMPNLDGLEVVRRVRAAGAALQPYLMMLTSKSAPESIVAALDAGANDYVLKPFNAAELRARVEVGRRLVEAQGALLEKNEQLQRALREINTLRGIIPICASCKRIRDDQGYWNQIESYIREHSLATFTHGICPECSQRLYPDLIHAEQNGNQGESHT